MQPNSLNSLSLPPTAQSLLPNPPSRVGTQNPTPPFATTAPELAPRTALLITTSARALGKTNPRSPCLLDLDLFSFFFSFLSSVFFVPFTLFGTFLPSPPCAVSPPLHLRPPCVTLVLVAAIFPRRLFDEHRSPPLKKKTYRANASDARSHRPIGGHAIDSSTNHLPSALPVPAVLPAAEVESLPAAQTQEEEGKHRSPSSSSSS
ncbi:hypothetical protein H0G86_004861 [Trichoderma simmonsii]|uniref:Uncharacterized protein n=1 Tax=Trichoderma simmonsii TaxID=1491479 RepID=A0A8G0LD62_9HYPO|nr:hypothetical protein H0G86_004861 [Trichoderma simmonsii]